MQAAVARALVMAGVLALNSGCGLRQSSLGAYVASTGLPDASEIASAPFFADGGRHCGPAALASVLVHAGIDTHPDRLSPYVFIPGRQGALQAEMQATVRRHNRLAYVLPARLDAVLREVRAGRPVVVLQQLGTGARGFHYAVLIGYDARQDAIVLRSGMTRRLTVPAENFDYTWQSAGRWAMVVLSAGELPVDAEQQRYVSAAAAYATVATPADAQRAWHAALSLWPHSLTALIGLGTAHYALNDLSGAIAVLQRAVAVHPDAADAHNNLAHVLGQAGHTGRAVLHARRAVALGGARVSTYRQTLRELER